MKKTFILLASFLLAAQLFPQEQFTEQTGISLTGVANSSVAWGDYDNDGDLDILLTGKTGPNNSDRTSKIYRNNGDNSFTEQTGISLEGVCSSSVAWGDYDNDGYLDILLTGSGVSRIYRNNGNNTFEQTTISLIGVSASSVAWGDYDNDGDLDILLTGSEFGILVSIIYRNNGDNTFTQQTSIYLTGVFIGSAAWGDYDNDGDLDILLTGNTPAGPLSKIYRNNGDNTFTEQTSISLTGVRYSSVAWGDYDNDGDLDILLTGMDNNNTRASIYRNNGDNTFTEINPYSISFVCYSSVAWGDYDNDGDLDILLTGYAAPGVFLSQIWRNDGNDLFTYQASIDLTGVGYSSAAWGDYDNDGDLDILLTGWTGSSRVSKIYRNNNTTPNTLPSIPSNLSTVINGENVTFSWNKSTDNETPQSGLRYNLVIGTTPNAVNTLSPMSDRNTGYRRVINLGNTNHKNNWMIKGLAEGTYYWSVQATDNAFAGSNFGAEQSFKAIAQFTEQTGISLPGVSSSSVAWGDYDNDNDLDILLSGYSGIAGLEVSKIYRNDGNDTFSEQTSISLQAVESGSLDWGDYDNDGDLDILLTGWTGSSSVSKIYRNNGNNTFTEQTSISLVGVGCSSADWGDYDNDGDLDILITGGECNSPPVEDKYSKIYRNNGDNTFTEQTSISLTGVFFSGVAWGDYDNDSDLDILLTGKPALSKIYRNDGDTTFTEQTEISLIGVAFSSVAWGDYNNDGDLDILLTGWTGSSSVSKIYRNNGDNSFTEQTGISLTGVSDGSVAWGDYDNDGDLDILLTGGTGSSRVSKIYRNNGDNTFTEQTGTSLTGVYASSVAWGDYDNDGDLDILLTGSAGVNVSKIYRNNNITPNTLPSAPSNLQSIVSGQDVTFSWDKSTDNETPQNGLRYNLVIGTTSNAVNTLSPMSDRSTGYRRVINLGNTNHNHNWSIKGLDSAQTYYWSVQALDNCFAASGFAPEQSVLITSVEDEELNKLPTEFELNQNFPNPFNPSTKIRYSVIQPDIVQIKIYDILGREVKTLVNEFKQAGSYEVQFDASELASGIYLYRIESGSFIQTKKMILLK